MTSKTVSSNTTSYAWDYENRLTSITLPGTTGTVTFKYDPFGRRIERISPTTTSIFVYDRHDLTQTVNSSGSTVARYAQGPRIDEPLAMQRGTTIHYYEVDALGSVTSITASNGSIGQSYTYDSFGNSTNSTGSLTNYFRYAGREFDAESNIYFHRARYYNPNAARFLSEDPVQFYAGANFYAYVNNNSPNLIDPYGTDAMPVPWPEPIPEPVIDPVPGIGFWLALDISLAQYDWGQFQRLCLASGWASCSPSPNPNPSPSKGKDCDNTTRDCEQQYEADIAGCRAIKSSACYDQAMQRYAA